MLYRLEAINSITTYDYISLITTFEIIYDGTRSFNCNHCINHLAKKTPAILTARACKEVRDSEVIPIVKKGSYRISYWSFVWNFYNYTAEYLISLFHNFKNGHLPEAGGLYDQPAKLVEIFDLMYSMESTNQEDQARKQRAKTGK